MSQPPVPSAGRIVDRCRFCDGTLSIPFCDLGAMPPSNSYVHPARASEPEPAFPLEARACDRCLLVQLTFIADAGQIFGEYAYLSSMSDSWLAHAERFSRVAIARFDLGSGSFVVEVASNDGYLLRNFVAASIPCLGIEPAANVAAIAVAAGIATKVDFLGLDSATRLVASRGHADLVVANNVMAHVPDINDFVAGLACVAGSNGVVSMEVPHLVRLIEGTQFDTVYHEHYAYWSLLSIEKVLAAHGLEVFDIERLATHGGSLRIFAAAPRSPKRQQSPTVAEVRDEEAALGVGDAAYYAGFEARVSRVLEAARALLRDAHVKGLLVAGYGAAAKGNTFLNALGAGPETIAFVADRSPFKQGMLLPGSRIPVVDPDEIFRRRPDLLIVLPWNIASEICTQMAGISAWGGRFAVGIPEVRVFDGQP